MVTRAANWGPWEYHTPVSLVPSLSLPSLLATSTNSASTPQLPLSFVNSASASSSSSLTLPGLQNTQVATPSSSNTSSPSTGGLGNQQQSSGNYNYASTTLGNMSHQQPRQPPTLNMAAAAATQDPSPYSAPPVTQSTYYGTAGGGGGSTASSATSAGGSGAFAYGNGMMLPAPQPSQMYTSGSPYPVNTFPAQHSTGPHRVHADVAGLSQHSLHEFHHGSGNAPMDSALLHSFDGTGMLPMKPKRKQVKNACVNCQKACKRCDEARPCSRCYKYGLTATCQDSARKERKRGIKRGPYKRRATTGSTPNNTSSLLQHPSMMLGNVYGQGSLQSTSPHIRSTISGGSSFKAESNGSAASSLYDGSSGGNFEGGHMMGAAQYTSSAPSSVQRMPTSLPSGVSMYDSPSVYGRESQHVSMQPPSGRPYGTTRSDYDRSSNYPMQYSSLSNGGNRYGTPVNMTSSSGMPGSAPAGAISFGGQNSSARGQGPSASGSSGFSPAMPQQQQTFLSAQHHRIHSDGSLATVSNLSGTTPSTSLSPRTPMGMNGNDLGALASGSDNKAYLHHPSSTTVTSIASNTASAFMNAQNNAGTGVTSGSSTPQPFPLHLPQAPRGRNGSGNNNSNHSNSTSAHEDRCSRPASRQDGSMLFHDNKSSLDLDGNASLSSRYQLPVPRSGSGENRPRSLLPKMENTTADIAAYGAAA